MLTDNRLPMGVSRGDFQVLRAWLRSGTKTDFDSWFTASGGDHWGGIAAAGGQSGTPRRFSVEAYDGRLLYLDGYQHPVVIDNQGWDLTEQTYPVILIDGDSKSGTIFGQTDLVTATAAKLTAAGVVIGTSKSVQNALDLADNGFRWKARVEFRPAATMTLIPSGRSVSLNGRQYSGPICVSGHTAIGQISLIVVDSLSNQPALTLTAKLSTGRQIEARGTAPFSVCVPILINKPE